MTQNFVFDQPHATRLTIARQDLLRDALPELRRQLHLETALDVGCGVGYFSAFLDGLGYSTVGYDGRQGNVEEAKRRFPQIDFRTVDIEDRAAGESGRYDLVLCFGLLYHLENPLRAVRNLSALTAQVLLVESMCVPENRPLLYLMGEAQGADQSLRGIAFYPSESCLIKMLYRTGFPFVWRWTRLPAHEDFHKSLLREKGRIVLAASRVALDAAFLTLAPEPTIPWNPWTTPWGQVADSAERVRRFLNQPWPGKFAALRRRVGWR